MSAWTHTPGRDSEPHPLGTTLAWPALLVSRMGKCSHGPSDVGKVGADAVSGFRA